MKPKILVLASFANSLIQFRLQMMKAFIARGYTVIACAPANETIAKKLEACGIRFVSLPLQRTGLNPLKDLFFSYHLFRILKKEKPDVIFSYTIKPVIYGSIVAKLCGVPHRYSMITGLGYVFSNTSLKSKLVGFIAKKLLRNGLSCNHKIFFQNNDNQEEFISRKMIKPTQAVLVNGSGVDISYYNVAPFTAHKAFLMIARLLIDKGVREYLQAAATIKQTHPDVEFFLVGWFDANPNTIARQELQHYIDAKIVTYLGEVADVRPIIANASVFVLPSYGEGTPRTVLEAMAMGRPIITTDVPGCRQTVVNGKNGFLVPAKNVKGLVDAMLSFIQDTTLIPKMGSASREIAVEKYDVNKVNAAILDNMML